MLISTLGCFAYSYTSTRRGPYLLRRVCPLSKAKPLLLIGSLFDGEVSKLDETTSR